MTDRRYWIVTAVTAHVDPAVSSGVASFGPDKESEASRPDKGDWLAYYSPSPAMDDDEEVRRITAVCQIEDDTPERREMPDDGVSWTRAATFHHESTADIYDLLDDFTFVKDRSHWGVHFHRSLLEVEKSDMLATARATGVDGRKL